MANLPFPTSIAAHGTGPVRLVNARGEELILSDAFGLVDEEQPRTSGVIAINSRHGSVFSGRTRWRSSRGVLRGHFVGDTLLEIRRQIASIYEIIQWGPVRLYLQGVSGRYLSVEFRGPEQSVNRSVLAREIRFPFTSDLPFWISDAEIAGSSAVRADGESWAESVAAQVEVEPVFVIDQAPTVTELSIESTTSGDSFRYRGAALGAAALTLAFPTLSATLGPFNVLGRLDASFRRGFQLRPGDNALSFDVVPTTATARVSVRYITRYFY